MSRLLRSVARLVVLKVLRWLVMGVLSRLLIRCLGRRSAQRATAELETTAQHWLPAPLGRAVAALPGGAKAAGGSVIVAGRAGRSVVIGSRRASRLASAPVRLAATRAGEARAAMARMRDDTDGAARRLRAQYLEATAGPAAATEAMLDLRPPPTGGHDRDPHTSVPAPIRPGRRRSPRHRVPPVNRVRRTYHPPPKPWE